MSRDEFKPGDKIICQDEKDVHTRIECLEDYGYAFHVDWKNLTITIKEAGDGR